MDIDYFKRVNDNYGHVTGDYVLREISNILKKIIQQDVDWIARYGGEEFLICLPGANSRVAFDIAERMRKYIEEYEFLFKKENINITSSFGVYTLKGKNVDMEKIIHLADQNMYKAKNNGRNLVIASSEIYKI